MLLGRRAGRSPRGTAAARSRAVRPPASAAPRASSPDPPSPAPARRAASTTRPPATNPPAPSRRPSPGGGHDGGHEAGPSGGAPRRGRWRPRRGRGRPAASPAAPARPRGARGRSRSRRRTAQSDRARRARRSAVRQGAWWAGPVQPGRLPTVQVGDATKAKDGVAVVLDEPLGVLSLSLAGSGMVHRAPESRTVRPTRWRRLRHRAGHPPHHTPCRFGPERKVVAGPACCGSRTRDRTDTGRLAPTTHRGANSLGRVDLGGCPPRSTRPSGPEV